MKNLLIAIAVVGLASPTLLADDLNPPPWVRGAEYTTYQAWDAWTNGVNDVYEAEAFFTSPNASENPWIHARGGILWGKYNGRDALAIEGDDPIEIHLPNWSEDQDRYKEIYLQIVWHLDAGIDIPELVSPAGYNPNILVQTQHLGDNWYYEQYHWLIDDFNPDFELITIQAVGTKRCMPGLFIDQIIVDTICVPEPTTLSLLAFGVLVLIRRR